MLDRLSVSLLLKAIIATLATIVVILLALGARDSWNRVGATDRIAAVAETTAHLFKALHNLRVDRATTFRDLNGDKQLTTISPQLREAREAEMPALKSALAALQGVDFPERQGANAELDQAIKKLAALHEESAAAFLRPKSERRAGLAQESFNHINGLLEMLDKLSSRLSRLVKLEDPFIDQLLEVKQLAWVARNSGGDASVMISNTLGGQPLPPDALMKYTTNVGKGEGAWAMLEEVAAGLPLPARFTEAVDKAKRDAYAPDFVAMRLNMLKSLIAGEKLDIDATRWAGTTVPKLALILGVAEVALDVAKQHAAQQHASAMWMLGMQLGLLAAAVAFAAGMVLMVSRRVTGPLGKIQEAMLKVAAGDLSAEVSFGHRRDEIGALGNAMQAFKGSVVEAERLRAEQKDTEARAAAQRKADMQRLADDFQAAVGNIVDAVSTSSGELENLSLIHI